MGDNSHSSATMAPSLDWRMKWRICCSRQKLREQDVANYKSPVSCNKRESKIEINMQSKMVVLWLCLLTDSNEHSKSVIHLPVMFKSHPVLNLCNHLLTYLQLHKHQNAQLHTHLWHWVHKMWITCLNFAKWLNCLLHRKAMSVTKGLKKNVKCK